MTCQAGLLDAELEFRFQVATGTTAAGEQHAALAGELGVSDLGANDE